ncbi:MAG: hypothetical protein ACJASB_001687 [Shewanella psychromarinicola]|jgi:hypothetical protein
MDNFTCTLNEFTCTLNEFTLADMVVNKQEISYLLQLETAKTE